MRVVVDANVLAAALVRPGGWTAAQLARTDVEFVAPEWLAAELKDHQTEFAEKARCGLEEWRRRCQTVLGRIRLIPSAELRPHRDHRFVRAIEAIDPDDVPYVLTFLAAGADFVWTRDAAIQAVLRERAGPVIP